MTSLPLQYCATVMYVKDSRFKRVTAETYYRLLSLLGVDVVENHADFRLMRRPAINRLLSYDESNLYLRGVVPLVGHKTDVVYYSRLPRKASQKLSRVFMWNTRGSPLRCSS